MKLREVELALNKGMDVVQASRQAGISEQSYYRWRKEYGGMQINQAKKCKELECEKYSIKKTGGRFKFR